jgi:AraC-like DNA-binding protein/predicted transcriptional regulator YdeE
MDVDHFNRINRILDFIESNLDRDIHLEVLARQSAFSKYHFHRIFKAVLGDPPFKYIEKRRLFHAAHDLLYSQKRIIDIALDYGFNSHEAFIRSFKKNFSLTPSQFRKTKSNFDFPEKCQVGPLALKLTSGTVRLNPRIADKPGFVIAGLTYAGHDANALYGLWEKFWQLVSTGRINLDTSTLFGACFHDIDMRNNEVFQYYAGVEAQDPSDLPQEIETVGIPQNTYALFTHRGSITEIERTYDLIYGNWLPLSTYSPTMDLDIIVVDDRFKGLSPDSEIDILIPIQSEKARTVKK